MDVFVLVITEQKSYLSIYLSIIIYLSIYQGVTGSNVFPVRMSIPEQTTTRFQPLDEINDGLHGPFFKLENLGETGLLNKQPEPNNNNKEIQVLVL